MYMVVDYSEDRELLTLLRRGEISAFVDIYTTYYDALLNYADRLLNDMETASGFACFAYKNNIRRLVFWRENV